MAAAIAAAAGAGSGGRAHSAVNVRRISLAEMMSQQHDPRLED